MFFLFSFFYSHREGDQTMVSCKFVATPSTFLLCLYQSGGNVLLFSPVCVCVCTIWCQPIDSWSITWNPGRNGQAEKAHQVRAGPQRQQQQMGPGKCSVSRRLLFFFFFFIFKRKKEETRVAGPSVMNPVSCIIITDSLSFSLLQRHKGFLKDCPNGLLTEKVQKIRTHHFDRICQRPINPIIYTKYKKGFIRIYKQFFPQGDPSKFATLVFRVFDENNVNISYFFLLIKDCGHCVSSCCRKFFFISYPLTSSRLIARETSREIYITSILLPCWLQTVKLGGGGIPWLGHHALAKFLCAGRNSGVSSRGNR